MPLRMTRVSKPAVFETYVGETRLEGRMLVCRAADGLRLHELPR